MPEGSTSEENVAVMIGETEWKELQTKLADYEKRLQICEQTNANLNEVNLATQYLGALMEASSRAVHGTRTGLEALLLCLAGYEPGQYTEEINGLEARRKLLNNPKLQWEPQMKDVAKQTYEPARFGALMKELFVVKAKEAEEKRLQAQYAPFPTQPSGPVPGQAIPIAGEK